MAGGHSTGESPKIDLNRVYRPPTGIYNTILTLIYIKKDKTTKIVLKYMISFFPLLFSRRWRDWK